MTAAPGIRPCFHCRRPELPDYPHRHERPLRSTWDPMPERPERLYCGPLDTAAVDEYWTGSGWRPECCLVHVIGHEYRAEMPDRVHPVRYRVPARTEPIPLHPGDPDGPTLDVLDSGAGWPWAPAAHRRFGAHGMRDGDRTLSQGDYAAYPWAYAIERRLDGHCRRRHVTRPDLWPEHERQPLCSDVVREIMVWGDPPERVLCKRGIPPIRTRPVLADALLAVWRFVSEAINEIDLRRARSAR